MAKRFVIGVDIGGTNMRAALVDEEGRVVNRMRAHSTEEPLQGLIKLLASLMEVKVEAIGVGVAGVVDRATGTVSRSPNLPVIEGQPIAEELQRRFGVPAFVENDANMAALGESWIGAGRDSADMVMLTLGTGVGGGVVYRGQLLEIAAELGHITVEADGLSCPCGNTGCLESYVSARALTAYVFDALESGTESLMRDAYEGNYYRLTSEDIYRFALEGDTLARDSLRRAGRYLGIGIASLVNIFSPEVVVIGGGLLGAWEILSKEATKEVERRAFKALVGRVRILPAVLGDDAGVVGAARMALDRI